MELIYNLQEVKKLLESFYHLTNFRIALFDHQFHEQFSYPTRLSRLCKLLRTDNQINEACRQCDYHSFLTCRRKKSTMVYTCHLGLSEIIVPIQSDSMIVGYLMCGQIVTSNDNKTQWEHIVSYLSNTKLDIKKVRTAYQSRTKVSSDKINSAITYLEVLAYYLFQSEAVSLPKNSLSYEIDQYILTHLTQEIDINHLCERFNYGRTNFYKLTNEIYGVGIMKHIRSIRIFQAKELLSSTDLPINQVAACVGIPDYNYFTKVFKSEVFCTPREFRNNNFSLAKETN